MSEKVIPLKLKLTFLANLFTWFPLFFCQCSKAQLLKTCPIQVVVTHRKTPEHPYLFSSAILMHKQLDDHHR